MIIPPVSDCFMPTLGAAQIVGYLKSCDISCRLFDINAELNHAICNRVDFLPGEVQQLICHEENEFCKLVSVYKWLSVSQLDGCSISTDDFSCDFDWKNVEQLENFLNDEKSLIYRLLSNLNSIQLLSQYSIIGFSISYSSQLVLSIVLVKIIKSLNPNIKVIFGGSFFYNYGNDFFNVFYDYDKVDYVIIGSGENVIYELIVNGLDSLQEMEGIECFTIGQRAFINSTGIKNIPIVYDPCFDDLNFNFYPSKQKAFPYMVRSVCYYGKCKFCNGDKVLCEEIYKRVEDAFCKMLSISEHLNIRNVYIVDAALSPKDFIAISEMKIEGKINWIANARFDKPLANEDLLRKLYSNGCKMLRFGLESGSQFVLDLMRKGTDITVANRILELASKCGIQNHVYIMLGYPGETEYNRKETIDFLKKNREYISSYSISFFQPIPNTAVYNELKEKMNRTSDDEYSDMIEYIYKNDEYYQSIVKDAEKIREVLEGYSQTNGEYYSANIFSGCIYLGDQVRVCLDHIKSQQDSLFDLNNEVEITRFACCDNNEYVLIDLYRDVKVRIIGPDYLNSIISMRFSGGKDEFERQVKELVGVNNYRIALELISILSKVTHYVVNYSECGNSAWKIKRIKGTILSDMSIQFSPDNRIEEE